MSKVLVVDDDTQMQIALKASLSRAGYDVSICSDGEAALAAIEKDNFKLIISDQRMPKMTGQELLAVLNERSDETPFVMITAHGTIDQAVEAMQLGASDFITKPFSAEELVRVVEKVTSEGPRAAATDTVSGSSKGRPIITNDSTMIRILEVCEAVSRSDATVLVQGESGTGKELIARLIHASSVRAENPFVAVNCAALPDSLLESELFGHEKGAFTGAQARKIGKFELANGGTILLDEISEMELPLQAKLLRVLQEREVDRVGGKNPIPIDVRVVATTNRDIEKSIERGEFRSDLYYRLNVIPITLPALRDRVGDVELLVKHFMKKFLGKSAPELSLDVLSRLKAHSWPGNVRELQNAVERAAILSAGATPQTGDFFLAEASRSPSLRETIITEVSDIETPVEEELRIRSGMTVHEMEKRLILETLKSTENNRTQAAKMLGISIRTLRNKLNEYKGSGEFTDA